MVVILVLLTFFVCFLADRLLRNHEPGRSEQKEPASEIPRRELRSPIYAGGFQIQPEMAYHPGHTWALREGPNRVRVGIDDFAAKMMGDRGRVVLPETGRRLVQGRAGWTLERGQRKAAVLAPVSGRILAVNPAVRRAPGLVFLTPYARGWLLLVEPTDLRANLNNLLAGDLVRRWMEDAAQRLRAWLSGGIVISFPDGGTAAEDLSSLIEKSADWDVLVREFLRTDPGEELCSGR